MATFIEFDLYSDALCMGERTKGGLFRPCVRTIPYSQISGALRRKFGTTIHAAGYLINSNGHNRTDYFTYAPKDKARTISKVPLKVEFLTNVYGKVYVLNTEFTANLPDNFTLLMGALISKGFGHCTLYKRQTVEGKPEKGFLKTRIPLNKKDLFDIKAVIKPVYGFLFEPTSPTSGVYVLSLFEGSVVSAPVFLISAERR